MTTQEVTLKKTFDWRVLLFRILAGLASLFFLTISVPYLLWPWVIVLPDMPDPESQRWFAAQWGVLVAFFGALPLILVMIKPRQYVNLMQYWVIGFLLISLFWFIVGEKTIDSFVILALMLLTFPNLRGLFKLDKSALSKKLAIFGILAILGCLPRLLSDFNNTLALIGGSAEDLAVMDNFTHEIDIFLYIALGVIFVALKHSNWKIIGNIIGASLIYSGIAALFTINQPGSWGFLGGAVALLWGVGYLAIIRLEAQTSKDGA